MRALSFIEDEVYMLSMFRFKLELGDEPWKTFEIPKNEDGIILFGLGVSPP